MAPAAPLAVRDADDRGEAAAARCERAGEEVDVLRGHGVQDHLRLVGGDPLLGQRARHVVDIELDADLLPVLLDHLAELRAVDAKTRDAGEGEAEAALAVLAQPVAVAVLLREADLVEELVRLGDVERRPLRTPLLAREVEVVVTRRG